MCRYCEQTHESNMKKLDYTGIELERNGQASLYMNINEDGSFELIADDSWDMAKVRIEYCPFWGRKL